MRYFPTAVAHAPCLRGLAKATDTQYKLRGDKLPEVYYWNESTVYPLRDKSRGCTFVLLVDSSEEGKARERENPAQAENPLGREHIIQEIGKRFIKSLEC